MFFTASILIGLACIAIAVFVIVINNLIARYWKSLDWFQSWNFTQQPASTKVETVANDNKK